MSINEFVEEKRGTYDKFYTMYEVCKSLNIQGIWPEDPVEAIREVCKLFMEHVLYREGVVDVSVLYGDFPLDAEEVNSFVYELEEFYDPLSGENEEPEIYKLDVRFVIKKFEADSKENIIVQEINKCRSLSYFYNTYVREQGEAEYTDEDIENMVKNTLKLRGRI